MCDMLALIIGARRESPAYVDEEPEAEGTPWARCASVITIAMRGHRRRCRARQPAA